MAILNQSSVFPIGRARALHQAAQRQYQWRFFLDESGDNVKDLDMSMLVQELTLPGINCDREAYNVGQLEFYHLGVTRRGGPVSATFIEIEGGIVDRYFRDWFEQVDPQLADTVDGGIVLSRGRQPIHTYARSAIVHLLKRDNTIGAQFKLSKLLPVRMGSYSALSYAGTGQVQLQVEMACDQVVRMV